MFVGTIPNGSYTANTDIPIMQLHNTNAIYSLSENKVSVHKSGITDVKANIVVKSDSDEVITVQLYADSNPMSNIIASFTPTTDTNYTFPINCPVLIKDQWTNNDVKLSFRINQDCTLVGGYVSMEFRN